MRDYYDIYILHKIFWDEINIKNLIKAIKNTSENRNTFDYIKNYKNIMIQISEDENMKKQWNKYQNNYFYAKDITYTNIIETINKILMKVL